MTSDDLTAASRFLSYVLRHNPAAIGASLDEAGWISIDMLLAAAARRGHSIDRDTLGQLINSPGVAAHFGCSGIHFGESMGHPATGWRFRRAGPAAAEMASRMPGGVLAQRRPQRRGSVPPRLRHVG